MCGCNLKILALKMVLNQFLLLNNFRFEILLLLQKLFNHVRKCINLILRFYLSHIQLRNDFVIIPWCRLCYIICSVLDIHELNLFYYVFDFRILSFGFWYKFDLFDHANTFLRSRSHNILREWISFHSFLISILRLLTLSFATFRSLIL